MKKSCQAVCNIARYVTTIEESKSINLSPMPKIIISASGMASGGRVLHHLKSLVGDHRNTILFAGYQAGGTRGDRMVKGESKIKIHGDMHLIKARVVNLSNLSAHADYNEILFWLSNFKKAPKKVYITHGEPEAAQCLCEKIIKKFNWNVLIPEYLQSVDI
ncbi:MBL fold metallo-hydrolase RNA specificity domain-containing protein [Piscirickettsia litoralis]|uniref:MBL fold metallo-hydrolase RNA specificity domain-containing protein n=1 Tax=Piscirickettsia litoralis TaxID=1891921 RepID=UPI000A65F530|nr:MBL fold metallo-hydrolase RNA specificity domain-containing protein [Piscirickettsia litoralis]